MRFRCTAANEYASSAATNTLRVHTCVQQISQATTLGSDFHSIHFRHQFVLDQIGPHHQLQTYDCATLRNYELHIQFFSDFQNRRNQGHVSTLKTGTQLERFCDDDDDDVISLIC